MTDPRARITELTEDMQQSWRIAVEIPAHLPAEDRDRLFTAIAEVVHDWEPAERDWDAFVRGHDYRHSAESYLADAVLAAIDLCDKADDGVLAPYCRAVETTRLRHAIANALEGKP